MPRVTPGPPPGNSSRRSPGNGFLLLTKTYGFVAPDVDAWFAPAPDGPWQPLGTVFSIPQPPPSYIDGFTYSAPYTYGPVVLASTAVDGGLLGAYNVGTFAPADAQRDGRMGIPRFVAMHIPPPLSAVPRAIGTPGPSS